MITTFSNIFIVALILFNRYLMPHFATDSYLIFEKSLPVYATENSLLDGRLIQFFIMNMVSSFHISIEVSTVLLTILAILITCLAVMVIKKEVEKYKTFSGKISQFFLIASSFFTIFNFMYLENMYFQECFVMALSILFYILSAKMIVNKPKHNLLKATLLMLLAIFCYQGTISCFFITTLVFSILKEKKGKAVLKNMLQAIAISGLGILANLLFIHWIENILHLSQTRDFDLSQLLRNIEFLFQNFTSVLINTGYLFYPYAFILFLISIEILLVLKLRKEKNPNTQNILLEQFIIILGGIAFSFITSVYNLSGFASGRIRFSLGATIGFLLLHIMIRTNLFEKNGKYNLFLKLIFILYFIALSITIITNTTTVKKVNELDKTKALEMGEYVKDYEAQSGTKVENLAVIIDVWNAKLAYYTNLNYIGSITTCSALRTSWSVRGAINYYNQTNLKEKEITKNEIEQYLKQVDERQYLCMQNTLYVTCYMY